MIEVPQKVQEVQTMSTMMNHIRRLIDAVVTALAVVFGLVPDPTLQPVRQRAEVPRIYRRGDD